MTTLPTASAWSRRRRSTALVAAALLGMAGLLLGPAEARAEVAVTASLSPETAEIGEPVTLTITVRGARRVETPKVAPVATMTIDSTSTLAGRTEGIQTINGRMERWIEYRWQYAVMPNRTGRLTLPAITVRADEREYQTDPLTLVVTKGQGGGAPLIVELDAAQKEVFVEEPLRATLRIWIRVFRQRREGIALNAETTLQLLVKNQTQIAPFENPAFVGTRTRPDEEGNATSYYVYECNAVIWPEQAGPLTLPDLRVVIDYPTQLGFDVFRQLRHVGQPRRLTASPDSPGIVVKPIPEEGRPPGYNGAVGQYTLSVAARPTDVAVGDPITLTLSIRGTGRLERIAAPLLGEMPELARDFKIPAEPLAGRVEGLSKIFTQTLRASRAEVKQIPPISFSFFNPQTARFESVASAPIAIRVSAGNALALSQVVEAEPGREKSNRPLVERSEGLLANYEATDDLLVDQRYAFGPGFWAMLIGCPLAFVVAALVQRRGARYRDDVAFRRRAQAAGQARKRLRAAGGAADAPAQVGAALADYVADRVNAPPGALTRDDACRLLRERGAAPELIAEVDALLGEADLARYGAASLGPAADLAAKAERCIDRLERARLA